MTSPAEDGGGGSPAVKRRCLADQEEPEEEMRKIDGQQLPLDENKIPIEKQKSIDKPAETSSCSTIPIEAILPDSLIKPIIYERCVIATLGDKRLLSAFIQEVNKAFPLPTFQHLKRVRNGQVLLFPVAVTAAISEGEEESKPLQISDDQVKVHLIKQNFPEHLIAACGAFTVEDLPAVAPLLKCQYSEVVQRWPCKFHEDKALEKLSRNENFSPRETRFHCRMMELCLDLRSVMRSECVALAFDPAENEIVACGWKAQGLGSNWDREIAEIIPSGHAAMRAIDHVAARQGGGAWTGESDQKELLDKGMEFAKKEISSFSELIPEKTKPLKFGAYLCTGMDMYLTDEPCLMCAMAMVHSRVKRIFFARNSPKNGALGGGSQLKLHGVKELNHHYEVFRVNGGGDEGRQ